MKWLSRISPAERLIDSGTKASPSTWLTTLRIGIQDLLIFILLAFAIYDYGWHRHNSGYTDGYWNGHRDGLQVQPKVWKTVAPRREID